MANNQIHISPNVPLYLALADPEGDAANFDFELRIGRYQTTDGRVLALPEPAVIRLNMISPKCGEEIQVTKIWSGKAGESTQWSICLSTRAENARAEAGEPDTLTAALEASIDKAEREKANLGQPTPIRKPAKPAGLTEQPKLFDRGTGTYGPMPQCDPRLSIPISPMPLTASGLREEHSAIPANVATREILAFIELDPNTKGWSDQAKQDLASTVYISACKSKWIGLWERGEK